MIIAMLVPRPRNNDPLGHLVRTAGEWTGVTPLLEEMRPGGGLHRFASSLAGGHPGQAWDQYRQWRGPWLEGGGDMALPWGPGVVHVPGTRTPPARSLQEGMRNQETLDMWRDASRSISEAPTLTPGTAWAQSSMNELRMRELGMGKPQMQARAEQGRLRKQAFDDQQDAMLTQLTSLLPPGEVVPFLTPVGKDAVHGRLVKARNQALSMMDLQKRGVPIHDPTSTIPAMLEQARGRIGRIMHDDARAQPNAAHAEDIRRASQRLMEMRPGGRLERPDRMH